MKSTRCLRIQFEARQPSEIIKIENGTFFRHHPSSTGVWNPPLFSGLSFTIGYEERPPFDQSQYWAIIGPSSSGKTTFLELLRGLHFCEPATARSYPHFSSLGLEKTKYRFKDAHLRNPLSAIRYVGFDGTGNGLGALSARGAYLSARYESRREPSDISLLEYLEGKTSLNPDSSGPGKVVQHWNGRALSRAIDVLSLRELLPLSIHSLSNGQGRRARIAKAIAERPRVVLLDEPFRMLVYS